MNNVEAQKTASVILTAWLCLLVALLVIYSVAPLFDGKLFIYAFAKYASWIALGLMGKYFLRHSKARRKIGVRGWALGCAVVVISLILSTPYPVNIAIAVLCAVAFWVAYGKLPVYAHFESTNQPTNGNPEPRPPGPDEAS